MTAESATGRPGEPGPIKTVSRVQLLHVPGCALLDRVRATLQNSLTKTSVHTTIEEIEGPYSSPTLLIDGLDVTGRTPGAGPSCRLDLPTEDQILSALASTALPTGLQACRPPHGSAPLSNPPVADPPVVTALDVHPGWRRNVAQTDADTDGGAAEWEIA